MKYHFVKVIGATSGTGHAGCTGWLITQPAKLGEDYGVFELAGIELISNLNADQMVMRNCTILYSDGSYRPLGCRCIHTDENKIVHLYNKNGEFTIVIV